MTEATTNLEPIIGTIESVEAETLTSKAGKLQGYRYVAHLTDGTTAVIRAKATRRYLNAYTYAGKVNWSAPGLGAYFTFGKNPASHLEAPSLTFPVWSTDDSERAIA